MLRVGIIGLGRMGKLHFLNTLHIKDVKLIAAADKSKENRKIAEKYHVKAYDDYADLINHEELDCVIISLPNFLKKESIFCASEKNLDIFVDKPLARNSAEAADVARKIRNENTRLMVGVNYRYFDSVQKLKKIAEEGSIGDVVIATADLIMDGPFSHSLVPKPVPEWWFDKEKAGGGALLDLGYHLIDILEWIFGSLHLEYSNIGHRFGLPIEDSATVVLKSSSNGARCTVNTGWFSKTVFPSFNFRINLHGTVGYASTDQYAPRNLFVHAMREGALNLSRRIVGKEVHYLSYTYYYASFIDVLEKFFDALRKDEQLPISLEGQVNVVKTIDSVYRQNGVF